MGKTRGVKPQSRLQSEENGEGQDYQAGEEAADVLQAHTETILAAIKDTKSALESQIAAVANEVGILRDQQRKTVERVKATEILTAELAPAVKELTLNITKWKRN